MGILDKSRIWAEEHSTDKTIVWESYLRRFYAMNTIMWDYLTYRYDMGTPNAVYYQDVPAGGWDAYFQKRLNLAEWEQVRSIDPGIVPVVNEEYLRVTDEALCLWNVVGAEPTSSYYKSRPDEWKAVSSGVTGVTESIGIWKPVPETPADADLPRNREGSVIGGPGYSEEFQAEWETAHRKEPDFPSPPEGGFPAGGSPSVGLSVSSAIPGGGNLWLVGVAVLAVFVMLAGVAR